jgi:hypothetical protein
VKKTERNGRVRLFARVDAGIGQRLEAFCGAAGVTESAAIEASLRQYLDRSSDATMLLRRMDRLGRAQEHTQRDLELLSETFAVWTKLWFAHTPVIAPDAKGAARLTAESRYRQFVEHVGEQFFGGKRFLDDLPREALAALPELEAAAQAAETRPNNDAARGCRLSRSPRRQLNSSRVRARHFAGVRGWAERRSFFAEPVKLRLPALRLEIRLV